MTAPLLAHRIGDEWVAETPGAEDRNPAHPDEVIALVSAGTPGPPPAAAHAAREALPGWAAMPAPARGEILFRAAALLAERAESVGRDLAREEGKTLAEGIGETRRAAAILRYFAGQTSEPIGEVYASATPGTRLYTQRGPVGVVAAITPWNFPIAIPAWKIAPALAYGNTVLFKPAGATPLTANHLVAALVDAGLPAGVLAMVFADGARGAGAWIASGAVDAVTFTGSEAVGRRLPGGDGARHAKVQLELGGKNAVVVAPDADIARAAEMIVRGAMASAGQKCTATSRVIAIGEVAGPLREAIVGARPWPRAPGIHASRRRRWGRSSTAPRATGSRAWSRKRRRTARGSWCDRTCRRRARSTPRPCSTASPRTCASPRTRCSGRSWVIMAAADLDEAIRLHNAVAYGLSGRSSRATWPPRRRSSRRRAWAWSMSTARRRAPSRTSRSAA